MSLYLPIEAADKDDWTRLQGAGTARAMCGTCRELLNEAMNLAVRSEQFEEQLRREAALGISQDAERWQASGMFDAYVERHNAEYPGSRIAPRSMTMHLWVQDQYDKDLASWRERTAAHLTQCNEAE